jgi:hypothetical protein
VQLGGGLGEGAAAVDGVEDLQGVQAESEHSNFSIMEVNIFRFLNRTDRPILRSSDGETDSSADQNIEIIAHNLYTIGAHHAGST